MKFLRLLLIFILLRSTNTTAQDTARTQAENSSYEGKTLQQWSDQAKDTSKDCSVRSAALTALYYEMRPASGPVFVDLLHDKRRAHPKGSRQNRWTILASTREPWSLLSPHF